MTAALSACSTQHHEDDSRPAKQRWPDHERRRTALTTITIDGQTFAVSLNGRQYMYDWVGGRHHGDYGFTSTASDGSTDLTEDDHRTAIADFLADINPETGHLD